MFFMIEKKTLTVVVPHCEIQIKGKNIIHYKYHLPRPEYRDTSGNFFTLMRAKFESSFAKVHRFIRYNY